VWENPRAMVVKKEKRKKERKREKGDFT